MTFKSTLIAGALAAVFAATAQAAVTPEEAKQLGTTLTLVGAEKAGNADRSIPEYTGGLTTPPAGFKPGSGLRPDPFASEKPLQSITAKNIAEHEARLTAGTRELLKRNPASFRVDVYSTHRTAALPKYVTDNTVKNATSAKTDQSGLGLQTAYAGYPFPIPKTGNEAMWNHLLRFIGHSYTYKFDAYNVDASGKATLSSTGLTTQESPIYDPKRTGMLSETETFQKLKFSWSAPARRAGEAIIVVDSINPNLQPRRAWIYLPGQRRVKLAPEVGYDTPNPGTAGMTTYDDNNVFNGAMDRYDFKLVGKKEMLVPYNNYKLVYGVKSEAALLPHHLDPDAVRWELHRVWVVEATLKPGKRHIYAKRVFYLDEDSWTALASDQYDARGQLYRSSFAFMTPAYEVPAPTADVVVGYDFVAGSYAQVLGNFSNYIGVKFIAPPSASEWSPDSLSGAGIR